MRLAEKARQMSGFRTRFAIGQWSEIGEYARTVTAGVQRMPARRAVRAVADTREHPTGDRRP
jgi:hypothetical protein